MSVGDAISKGYLYADFLLDPSALRCTRSPRGNLILHIGQEEYIDLNIRRAFPLEDSNRYIGFFLHDGTELGLLDDPAQLEEASRDTLLQELDKIYFRPVSRPSIAWTRNSACCEAT